MLNVGILTGEGLSEFRISTLKPIVEDSSFRIKVAIVDTRPPKSLKQKLRKNIKRGRGGYVVVMALQRLFQKKEIIVNTKSYCASNGIDIIETNDLCSINTIERIKEYRLDVLLLVGGFGIIKLPLLNITPLGVLSYHHGDMRKYRGMPPGFWELFYNEKRMGITVQILSDGLDCGIPIEEKEVVIKKSDTLSKLQNRAYRESEDMMYKALKKVYDNYYTLKKIDSFGKVYTLPNLTQWVLFKFKILFRKLSIRS